MGAAGGWASQESATTAEPRGGGGNTVTPSWGQRSPGLSESLGWAAGLGIEGLSRGRVGRAPTGQAGDGFSRRDRRKGRERAWAGGRGRGAWGPASWGRAG